MSLFEKNDFNSAGCNKSFTPNSNAITLALCSCITSLSSRFAWTGHLRPLCPVHQHHEKDLTKRMQTLLFLPFLRHSENKTESECGLIGETWRLILHGLTRRRRWATDRRHHRHKSLRLVRGHFEINISSLLALVLRTFWTKQ